MKIEIDGDFKRLHIPFSFIADSTVSLKTYEATLNGYIESWIDRFRSQKQVCDILEAIWSEDKKYFPSLVD